MMDVKKFNWFLSELYEGKTLNICPYIYGDFLRYIQGSKHEPLFEKHMKREFITFENGEGAVRVWLQKKIIPFLNREGYYLCVQNH